MQPTRTNPWPWSRRGWACYAAFWLAIGLALALAEAQHPQRPSGRRPWEPFVLEISSVLVVGLLALAVYRLVDRLAERPRTWPTWLAAHVVGAALFFVAHVALMYLLRIPFYALLAGRLYAPMGPLQLLLYEGPKDLVSYAIVATLGTLVRARLHEQARAQQAAQAQAALAELRVARLSDQLQPHFLFNCLNTVSALIDEDPHAAVTMVARIGDFLRASLQHDGESGVSLAEELRLAEQYLAIQRLRSAGAVELRVEVPDALRGARVPHLLLQPLLENAAKHGVNRAGQPLVMVLVVECESGVLQLRLRNRVAATPPAPPPPGLGRGLALVRERLALLHGDAAGLHVQPSKPESEPGWYEVHLWMPLQREDN